MESDRPLAMPTRVSLQGFDHVWFGRGDRREVYTDGRQAKIRVDDAWMSEQHARLIVVAGQWLIEDLGSRNGVVVDGEAVDRVTLSDGAVIELGRTLFLFREQRPDDEIPDAVFTPDLDAVASPALLTASPELTKAFRHLARIADSDVAVMLGGESGTGKEVMAQAIHAMSDRRGRFVPVNCGGLSETLVQSELFGYRKGAFSGADEDRPGMVRAAHGGTLFLDEVGDLHASSQAVLLRVLQEKEVQPLGHTEAIVVDVRVVSATHRRLGDMVERDDFRADLYARLGGYELTLPPLRERREDLGLLVSQLLRRLSADPDLCFQPEAARQLFSFDWPLNIRQLEKSLARAIVLARGEPIDLEHLPDELTQKPSAPRSVAPVPSTALGDEDRERCAELKALLVRHGGNVSAIAREMGKDRKQIRRWLDRYGLDAAAHRD